MGEDMKKLYYSIGEVSRRTGVEAHVLRYWEERIPQLSPKKNKKGGRLFTEEDLNLIFELKELLYNQGYNTNGAKKVLTDRKKEKVHSSPDDVKSRLKADLSEVRSFLTDLLERYG